MMGLMDENPEEVRGQHFESMKSLKDQVEPKSITWNLETDEEAVFNELFISRVIKATQNLRIFSALRQLN